MMMISFRSPAAAADVNGINQLFVFIGGKDQQFRGKVLNSATRLT